MSTLNKWNLTTGMLNPALKSSQYDTIAVQMSRDNPKKSAAELIPEFESKLKSLGVRATVESFTEYFNAKVAVLRAIPQAPVKKSA